MATEIKKWAAETHKILETKSRAELDQRYFFRDPVRPVFIDSDRIFSPADGVLIYLHEVSNPKKAVLDIKGKSYNVNELLGDEDFDQPCIVAGIFMTSADVHVNRMPTAGIVSYHLLDPLATKNTPMLEVEEGLFKGIIDASIVDYMKANERMFNRIHCPMLNYTYYLIQIADEDVDVIMPFSVSQDRWYHQNARFSFVRFGSQVDLVLPKSELFDLKPLLKPLVHVEAGQDALFEIIKRENLVDDH